MKLVMLFSDHIIFNNYIYLKIYLFRCTLFSFRLSTLSAVIVETTLTATAEYMSKSKDASGRKKTVYKKSATVI